MTREQFYQLLQNPSGISYQHIEQLKDVLEQFPYFQTARMIYTKGLHDKESFLFSEELKKTAIYAGDRSVLHQLIHSAETATSTDAISFIAQNHVEETEATAILSVDEITFENTIENTVEETILFNDVVTPKEEVAANKQPEVLATSQQQEETFTDVENAFNELNIEANEPVADIVPETNTLTAVQILEQRLKELGGASKDELEENIQHEIIAQNFLGVDEKTDDLSFVYQSEEIKIELTEEVQQEEVIEKKTAEWFTNSIPPQNQTSNTHSFTDWLHQLKPLSDAPTSTTVETNKTAVFETDVTSSIEKKTSITTALKPITEPQLKTPNYELRTTNLPPAPFAQADLIDRFIQTDPRIEANKTKFYSPVNMAKSSIADAGEIVSETLANIYAQQGNYHKAISAFEKLSLKYPEKSHLFAARIKEMKGKD